LTVYWEGFTPMVGQNWKPIDTPPRRAVKPADEGDRRQADRWGYGIDHCLYGFAYSVTDVVSNLSANFGPA